MKKVDSVLFHPGKDYNLADTPFMMEKNSAISRLIVNAAPGKEEEMFNKIFSGMTHISAAGGLISNKDGDYLMIYRLGKWDLPKGKHEEGEEIKNTAAREVEEETGLKMKPGRLLCTTYHTYRMEDEFIIKKTFWYSMIYAGDKKPVPQTEEDITECRWISKSKVNEYLTETYQSITEVFKAAQLIQS